MITIKQIAELVGVSTATVSNVIHGKTKKVSRENIEKIERVLKETGYVQRMGLSALTNGCSKIIGVVVHSSKFYEDTILSDTFYGTLVGVLEQEIREAGYYMMFYASQNIEDIYRMALAWNIDGIIAITFTYTEYEKLSVVTNKPVVSIDLYDYRPGDHFINVGLDDEQGGYLMTRYLLQAGFDNILLFGHKNMGVDRLRWGGYRRALRENLPKIKDDSFHVLSEDEIKRDRQMVDLAEYVARHPGLALFFMSDALAVEAIMTFQGTGLSIPRDSSVVGYDDSVYGRLVFPKLTTVNQDIKDKGKTAMRILLDILAGTPPEQTNCLLPVKLIIRNSVHID